MFNLFKKKKDKKEELYYDPSDVRITSLVKGAFVDYDFKTWEVKDAFEYDWGNGYKAKELQLETAEELVFLYIDPNEGLECSLANKINIYDIEGDIVASIMNDANETPPMKVQYKGKQYLRSSEDIGYCRTLGTEDWEELISWAYYDEAQKNILTVERWGEEDFNASIGTIVEEYEFSNIIMP